MRKKVVILDLDHTLFETNIRKTRDIRWLGRYAREFGLGDIPGISNLSRVTYDIANREYGIDGVLDRVGIPASDRDQVKRVFFDRFLSDSSLVNRHGLPVERPVSGGVEFVHDLVGAGCDVIYLTGRHERDLAGRGMRSGTVESLRHFGFPVGDRGSLLMKPTVDDDDAEFKRAAEGQVRDLGDVVAVFDDSPSNIQVMREAYPDAKFFGMVHDWMQCEKFPTGVTCITDFNDQQVGSVTKLCKKRSNSNF